MTLWCALAVIEALFCVLAWQLARTRPSFRIVAALASYALADHLAIEAIRRHLLDYPSHPWHGRERALYHLATALSLGWPSGLAWAALRAFATTDGHRRQAELAPVAWAFAVATMAIFYPLPAGATAAVLQVWEGLAIAAGTVAIVRAWGHSWAHHRIAILLLLSVECAVATVGPFVRDPYEDWPLAQVAYSMGFVSVSACCVWWLAKGARWKRGSWS